MKELLSGINMPRPVKAIGVGLLAGGTLLLVAFAPNLIKTYLVEAFRIPGASMAPTLMPGDHILVYTGEYKAREVPRRGDIIVFARSDLPETEFDEGAVNRVKRVIGLPGEKVALFGDLVVINNQLLLASGDLPPEEGSLNALANPQYLNVTVPDGKLVVLGDNRIQSKDSRHWPEVFVDIENVRGRAFYIYFSSRKNFQRNGAIERRQYKFIDSPAISSDSLVPPLNTDWSEHSLFDPEALNPFMPSKADRLAEGYLSLSGVRGN